MSNNYLLPFNIFKAVLLTFLKRTIFGDNFLYCVKNIMVGCYPPTYHNLIAKSKKIKAILEDFNKLFHLCSYLEYKTSNTYKFPLVFKKILFESVGMISIKIILGLSR